MKHWITLNEPWSYSFGGYGNGILAPGRCSKWQQLNCTGGDSATEPYLVAHHQLLAHAAAVDLYRRKYQVHKLLLLIIDTLSTLYLHEFCSSTSVLYDTYIFYQSLLSDAICNNALIDQLHVFLYDIPIISCKLRKLLWSVLSLSCNMYRHLKRA